jgi:DNA-binding transcriptional LysR family regulator
MDLQWMRVLVELDRRGTLSAVAEATGYSKSAVSQQLAALQRAVGVPLAERVGRRLRLTPAGIAMLPSASQMLASVEAARGGLDPEAEPVGDVRVAAFASMFTGPVLRAIRELSARHPQLAISLQEREPREVDAMLTDDEADVGFVYDYSLVPRYRPDRVGVNLLAQRPMALIVPTGQHRGCDQEPTRILGGQAGWITNSRGSDDDELLQRVSAAHGGTARVAHRIDSLALITEFVAAGLGIALMVSDGPIHPGVRYVDLDGAAGSRRIYACTRPGRAAWRNNATVVTAMATAIAPQQVRWSEGLSVPSSTVTRSDGSAGRAVVGRGRKAGTPSSQP